MRNNTYFIMVERMLYLNEKKINEMNRKIRKIKVIKSK